MLQDNQLHKAALRMVKSLFSHIIEILATQGWQKIMDEIQDETTADSSSTSTDPWSSVTRIAIRFKILLENAGTDVDAVLCHPVFIVINCRLSSSVVVTFILSLLK